MKHPGVKEVTSWTFDGKFYARKRDAELESGRKQVVKAIGDRVGWEVAETVNKHWNFISVQFSDLLEEDQG